MVAGAHPVVVGGGVVGLVVGVGRGVVELAGLGVLAGGLGLEGGGGLTVKGREPEHSGRGQRTSEARARIYLPGAPRPRHAASIYSRRKPAARQPAQHATVPARARLAQAQLGTGQARRHGLGRTLQ